MYYKVLGKNGQPCHGGDGQWSLPHDGQPGEWMPKIHNIKPCLKGYHLCERGDVVIWLGDEIYEAEGRGKSIRHKNKTVFKEARLLRKLDKWDKRLKLLFIADCQEHVLHFFEAKYPEEDKPRKAIQATRDYANGLISQEVWVAAQSEAENFSFATLGSAARVIWAASVWTAEGATTGAAWAAAWAAGENKERGWQTDRLFELLGEP